MGCGGPPVLYVRVTSVLRVYPLKSVQLHIHHCIKSYQCFNYLVRNCPKHTPHMNLIGPFLILLSS